MKFSEQDLANLYCSPHILQQLIEACLAGKGSQSLAEIALQDAGLSARLISAASKTCPALLDSAEPVTSAIQNLGVPVITGIALQSAKRLVGRGFTAEELTFLNGLWFSSRVAGQAARCLAPTVSYDHVEEAQLSGLLLNLGMHVLFAREASAYVALAGQSYPSLDLCAIERKAYQTDHLQVAEQLITEWHLDSFLVDAVRFLHVDVPQIENGGLLLKITRLAQQFCLSPDQLTPELEALGERLFQFRKSEIDYLFDWAHGLYSSQTPPRDDYEQQRNELKRVLRRLTDLIFILADQESVRARLAETQGPEGLVLEARDLYLENCAATEAVFLLVDHNNNQLSGITAKGQSRLIGELKVSLDDTASLVVQALLEGGALCSLSETERRLTVTDQLLLRICGSRGFFCQPFRLDNYLLGVVVLGIDNEQDLEPLKSLRLKMFAQVVSSSLAMLASEVQERLNEGNSLLRRVSYELSNPLTIIGNYAEVLGKQLENDQSRSLTESIKREVKRIDDVLNYYLTRQEMPRFPDHSVSLNQLVQESVDALQDAELKPRHIRVKLDLKKDLERVATNEVLVKQILVNLMKNAAETVEKGGLIKLSTRDSYCADGARYVEVVVQDGGEKSDSQGQGRLLRAISSQGGMGHAKIGLRLVKGMVDDLGGRISFHSSSLSGTGFHLQIPCGRDTDLAAEPSYSFLRDHQA